MERHICNLRLIRSSNLLKGNGIRTALDLKNASDAWIRKNMPITGLRLVGELRGISCISLDEVSDPKKEISRSRSFYGTVENLQDLKEAVAAYTTLAAEKLREQNSVASYVSVFLTTDLFKKDEPQYSKW